MDHFTTLNIDKKSKLPLYQQLGDGLYTFIEKGILKPNTKLPPIRSLAKQLKINNTTVATAYKYLEKKGVVYAQIGSGTYVSPIPIDQIHIPFSHKQPTYKIPLSLNLDTINFASMTSPADLFPAEDFKTVINEIIDRDGPLAFTDENKLGFSALRQSICSDLQTYNIKAYYDQILIVPSARQAIDILSKALLQYRDIIFIEEPTYYGTIAAFQSKEIHMIEIPMQPDGINLSFLESHLKLYHPKFICIMSYYQNPTGFSYSLSKKKQLIDLAEKYDTYIIEFDNISDLNYNDEMPVPLKALDTAARVIYVKIFSKFWFPNIRLGFMVIPSSLLKFILSIKNEIPGSTFGLVQKAFDLYIQKNMWKKHIQTVKNIYYDRYTYFINELNTQLSDSISFLDPHGGLSIWGEIQQDICAESLCNSLLLQNVIAAPGSLFSFTSHHSSHIRLSFASADKEQITKGIRILKNILQQYP
jgi:DNA-binding transcriptional MocR family regulator